MKDNNAKHKKKKKSQFNFELGPEHHSFYIRYTSIQWILERHTTESTIKKVNFCMAILITPKIVFNQNVKETT